MKTEKLLYLGLPVLILIWDIVIIAAAFLASGLTITNILISILLFIISIVVFIFLIRGSFGILKGLKAQRDREERAAGTQIVAGTITSNKIAVGIMTPLTPQEEQKLSDLIKLRYDLCFDPYCDLSDDERKEINNEYYSLTDRKHYFKTDHYDYRKKFAEIIKEKD